MPFEDPQGHVVEDRAVGDRRAKCDRAIARNGKTGQTTDGCGRVLRQVVLAVRQAAAGVSGDHHRAACHQDDGGGQPRRRTASRSQHHAHERADGRGDPGPEVPVEEPRVVSPFVRQQPPCHRGRKAAERRQPEDGVEDDGRKARRDPPQPREADPFQQQRQQQQGDRQVEQGRVEPSEEQGKLREARAVPDLQEGQGGQGKDGRDGDHERGGPRRTTCHGVLPSGISTTLT